MARTQVWFTADLHIGHRLVAGLRGFEDDPARHDTELARRWDAQIADTDVVWLLGDISGGGRGSQQRALTWLAARPGTKHLITGNHDSVHPMHEDAHKALPAYLEVFASVQQSARRKLAGQQVLLSHFPYLDGADSGEWQAGRRFDQWRLPDCGAWLLHGHTHSASRRSGPRGIHVGLDAWGLAPVSIDQIAQILDTATA
ncbi:metallophosphoesterase [Mycolicibacterium iranicum]|uniref:Metallophosphoesterase n=1 Tax=Mycolicibacterium iranicum TaxID=912594 RepID=A0ABT4HQA6_MYCIR|nr:metallophosphoesterase [Mycolicibacterium iranicum]MCZ0732370.1 metallophosphoesterase [Mycolicibacterium iranicum]